MRLSIAAVAQVALTGWLVEAASTFSPARPPAIPLAVRSPYINTWLAVGKDGGNGGYLAGEWPQFWRYDLLSTLLFTVVVIDDDGDDMDPGANKV